MLPDARDLGAVAARDAAGVLLEVDRRERLHLAVEDDREVLEEVLGRALPAADGVVEEPAALSLVAGDLLESLRALAGELHQHDRLARPRVEVLPRPRQLEVPTRHLRDLRRLVLEEVEVVLRREPLSGARAVLLSDAALDDDRPLRHREQPVPRRDLPVPLRERDLPRADRPAHELLPLRTEHVVRLGVTACGERLLAREEVEELRCRNRLARARVDRGRDEVGLEVEQLQLRGLADDRGRGRRILDARQLDRDLVVALGANLGLRDAELVDARAHDRDRPVEVLLRQLAIPRRDRLQRDLEPALEVEAERRLLLER